MTAYHRVRVNTEEGPRSYWAKDFTESSGERFMFRVVNRDGTNDHHHVIMGKGDDLIWKVAAKMNLTYGWLETEK